MQNSSGELVARPAMRLVVLPALLIVTVLLPIPLIFSHSNWADIVWRFGFLAGGVYVGYQALARYTSTYTLSSLHASVSEGIFSKVTHAAPLNRITNLKLDRPFFKRIFGLADLMIDTPGGEEMEIRMREMTLREAKLFLAMIQEDLARQKVVDAGGDEDLRLRRQNALDKAQESEEI